MTIKIKLKLFFFSLENFSKLIAFGCAGEKGFFSVHFSNYATSFKCIKLIELSNNFFYFSYLTKYLRHYYKIGTRGFQDCDTKVSQPQTLVAFQNHKF